MTVVRVVAALKRGRALDASTLLGDVRPGRLWGRRS